MADRKDDDEREKGFVVKDRRFTAKKEEEIPPPAEEKSKGEPKKAESREPETGSERQTPLPEMNFINFILSLSTSALIQLGEVHDPASPSVEKDLPSAKQTIDLIGMLKEKTKGNLTPDEEKVMDHILYDLRMRYVRATG